MSADNTIANAESAIARDTGNNIASAEKLRIQAQIDAGFAASDEAQIRSLLNAFPTKADFEAQEERERIKREAKAERERADNERWQLELKERVAATLAREDEQLRKSNPEAHRIKHRMAALFGDRKIEDIVCDLFEKVAALETAASAKP